MSDYPMFIVRANELINQAKAVLSPSAYLHFLQFINTESEKELRHAKIQDVCEAIASE